jgi:hypothetical protein
MAVIGTEVLFLHPRAASPPRGVSEVVRVVEHQQIEPHPRRCPLLGHMTQYDQTLLIVEFRLGSGRLTHDRKIVRSADPGNARARMFTVSLDRQLRKRNNPRIPVGTGTGGVPHSEESEASSASSIGRRKPGKVSGVGGGGEAARCARLREAGAGGPLREAAMAPDGASPAGSAGRAAGPADCGTAPPPSVSCTR